MELNLKTAIDHLYNFKATDVTKNDKKEIQSNIQKYCPTLLAEDISRGADKKAKKSNNSLKVIMALGRKYNIPLATFVVDVFHRMMIDYWLKTHGETLKIKQWADNYLLMQTLKNRSKELYDMFYHLINTFHARIFTMPEIASCTYKIDDSLAEYVDIQTQICQILRGINIRTDVANIGDTPQPYPCQLDVWIIPKNVVLDDDDDDEHGDDHKNNQTEKPKKKAPKKGGMLSKIKAFTRKNEKEESSSSGDESPEEFEEKELSVNIGDIKAKLTKNIKEKIVNDFEMIDDIPRKNASWYSILRKKLKLENMINSLKAYKRYILIIDRRTQNGDNIHLYFYEAPAINGCNNITKNIHRYMRCENFFNSQECVLPQDPKPEVDDKAKSIGLFDSESGYMFALSFHINSADSIACYWASHGSAFRFLATDTRDIWPHYFVPDKKTGKNQIVPDGKFFEFEDLPFEKFHQITTGKLELYQRNSNPFGWRPKKPEIKQSDDEKAATKTKAVVIDPNVKLSEALRLALQNDAKYGEEIANTFAEVVEEQEYDTDNMAEDICDPDGSGLIDEMVEQNANLNDNDNEGILKVLLPIVEGYQNLKK